MDKLQYRVLLTVIVYMGMGIIFAIRAIGSAIAENDTWAFIYGTISLLCWAYSSWTAKTYE